MAVLIPSKAPNLVLAPVEYSPQQQEALTNQLRLYFATLDNTNAQLIAKANSASTLIWLGWGSC